MRRFSCLKYIVLVSLVAAATTSPSLADSGFEPFSVDDGSTKFCINGRHAKVILHLSRLVVEKNESWFSEDSAIVFSAKTTLSGSTGSGTETVTHTLLREYTLESYDEGVVTVPVRLPILSRFELSNDERTISNIVLDYNVYAVEDDTILTRAIKGMATVSSELPIPANPYTSAFQTATKFATGVFDILSEEVEEDGKRNLGSETYEFSEAGDCFSVLAQSGTTAWVQSVDNIDEGFIDIQRPGNYCLFADISRDRVLYAQRRAGNDPCVRDRSRDFKVRNPHIMYTMIARQPKHASLTNKYIIQPSNEVRQSDFTMREQAAIVTAYDFNESELSTLFQDENNVDFAATSQNLIQQVRSEEKTTTTGSMQFLEASDVLNAEQVNLIEAVANLERCQALGISIDDCL